MTREGVVSTVSNSPFESFDPFESAQKVADAVLYEGYALYPYRASAAKNRIRFQWGVLVPTSFTEQDPSERSAMQSEFLAERTEDTVVRLRVRFLHLSERSLELCSNGDWLAVEELDLGDEVLQLWDEAGEQQFELDLAIAHLLEQPVVRHFSWTAEQGIEEVVTISGSPGRIGRSRRVVSCRLEAGATRLIGPHNVLKVSVRIVNTTDDDSVTRDSALRRSLVGCHLLAAISGRGRFISSMAPPEWALGYLEECDNIGSFPVLVDSTGKDQVMLASPIILYDHPAIAPESPGDLFDALEIDEILTLRTMTLTEDEKRQARGTDPRTAAIIDHVDFLPPEMLDRLHGALRSVYPIEGRPVTDAPSLFDGGEAATPWWDPGADRSVSPSTDTVTINGTIVRRGSRVRLRPTLNRSDAQDMFLTGRMALVEGVLIDVDDNVHLAVVLEDDPAADLMAAEGRYHYFAPDEVEPIDGGGPGALPLIDGSAPDEVEPAP